MSNLHWTHSVHERRLLQLFAIFSFQIDPCSNCGMFPLPHTSYRFLQLCCSKVAVLQGIFVWIGWWFPSHFQFYCRFVPWNFSALCCTVVWPPWSQRYKIMTCIKSWYSLAYNTYLNPHNPHPTNPQSLNIPTKPQCSQVVLPALKIHGSDGGVLSSDGVG